MYPRTVNFAPLSLLRMDPREDPILIEEIDEHVPMTLTKYKHRQPNYKFDCMDGHSHPLRIETENYVLLKVHKSDIDASIFHQINHSRYARFSDAELDYIQSVIQQPEVDWAIENSFDGVYINKEEDYASMTTIYTFGVYLKTKQATFWRLKFNGQ